MDGGDSFDIYRGATEEGAEWVESVAGLSNALRRAEGIATDTPGQYFLFDPRSRSILMKIDSEAPRSLKRKANRNACGKT